MDVETGCHRDETAPGILDVPVVQRRIVSRPRTDVFGNRRGANRIQFGKNGRTVIPEVPASDVGDGPVFEWPPRERQLWPPETVDRSRSNDVSQFDVVSADTARTSNDAGKTWGERTDFATK